MILKKGGAAMLALLTMISVSFGTTLPSRAEEATESTAVLTETLGEGIEATADFSYYARSGIGNSGALYLTDNHTVTDVSATEIHTRYANFSLPDAWKGKVVIRNRYIDQAINPELYKNPVEDTYVIRIYEKNTWEKYRSKAYQDEEKASSMGELLEIRITNGKNHLSKWNKNPLYMHFAKLTGEERSYELYLKHPKRSEGLIDEEFAEDYEALSAVDFRSSMIRSFAANDASLSMEWANYYIQKNYVENVIESTESLPNEAESVSSEGEVKDEA